MRVETKKISDLKPAPYNPRQELKPGDTEYEKLKRSLEEFGYVEPVIWNERTGYVVGGHQRLAVLSGLGVSEIDCVIVDMPEAQEKALNVALNKISGSWDDEKLSALLKDLERTEIDLTLTGFDVPELDRLLVDDAEEEGYYGDERERTYDEYLLHEYDEARTAGYYQLPTLKACHYVPDDLIGFNYVKSWKGSREGLGVHFFLDDYQFRRMWTHPYENIERLRCFGCVLTPDFSTYQDMPLAMQIWNIYRMRLIGQMMQDAGLNVIPTLRTLGDDTIDWCLEGIEPGGVYANSTVGIVRADKEFKELCYRELEAVKRILKPECILLYGEDIGYDWGDIPVKQIKPRKWRD